MSKGEREKKWPTIQREIENNSAATHPVCDASGKDGLDHHARRPPADDPEAQAGAIVDQVNHLHLSPLRVQLRAKAANSKTQEKKSKKIVRW